MLLPDRQMLVGKTARLDLQGRGSTAATPADYQQHIRTRTGDCQSEMGEGSQLIQGRKV